MGVSTPASLTLQSSLSLNSGASIPILGYGVYLTPAEGVQAAVTHALTHGYRHVDGARMYRNEEGCGAAIRSFSGERQQEVFYTSKVPPQSMSYAGATAAVHASLAATGRECIDLYLLHAPYGGRNARLGAWQALVDAVASGEVRSIGVSNYGVHHLDELEHYIRATDAREGRKGAGGVLSVGQWELHPWLARPDIVAWCRARGVVCEAYSPLTQAERLHEPVLQRLGKKHNKSPAQILLRWSLQMGFVPLPKSVTRKLM